MDLLTAPPASGLADDLFVDRCLRLDGMRDVDGHTDPAGVAPAGVVPARALAGATVDSWADAYDAFSDHGFRLHPDAAGFPDVVRLCARTASGDVLVATVVEAELSVAVHATVADAAAWMGVDAESEGTRWAFQL